MSPVPPLPQARPLSALDRAHALRLANESEESLRLAASIVTASPDDTHAAWLLARLLFEAGRIEPAGKLAATLVERAARRGDLPLAVISAQLAHAAGDAAPDALERIAQTFAKGSPRVGKVAALPPTLPAVAEPAPHFAGLAGGPLVDAAVAAAQRVLTSKDAVAADAKVPELPLFGALEPKSLLELLGNLALRELPAGDAIVRQGDPGRDAFVVVRGVVDVERSDGAGAAPTRLASLGPGALFGEMALVSDAPRAASALAAEPVQLLAVTRPDLERMAKADPAFGRELGRFCHGRMLANLLRHSAIFGGIEPARRFELIERFETRRFDRGQKLVTQGEQMDCLYLLASGQVQVRSTDAQGERTVLAQLGPGDVVGEISLVLRRPASAEVVALSATVALSLSREQLHEATREHPELLRELYDLAVQRDEETRSVVAQVALDVSDTVIL